MTPTWKVFVSGILCTFLITACGLLPEEKTTQTAAATTAIAALWTNTPGATHENPQAISQTPLVITGARNEATPIGVQPATVQTAIAATKATFPIIGSVEIEEGRCCMGGIAGDTIEARVSFSATSSFGKVKEMRVRAAVICFTETEMVDTAWESFRPSKAYPVYVALNWIGFYVSVQYRDDRGNLSSVYCDDISVEGFPSLTSVPTP